MPEQRASRPAAPRRRPDYPNGTAGRAGPDPIRRWLLGLGSTLLGLAVLLVAGAVIGVPTRATADGNAAGSEALAATARGGWTAHHQPAANPALAPGCGLDIGLLIDRSGSIDRAGAADQMRTAAKVFVDALAGTPSRVGVWSLGTGSAADPGDPAHPAIGLTDVGGLQARPGATALKTLIDSIPIGQQAATNWDAGFRSVHTASVTTGDAPDLLVVLTDGQPTVFGTADTLPDPHTDDADIDAGIASANLVKGDGTRIFAVGIGADVDAAALSLVSGGIAWDRTNLDVAGYALTRFDELAATLRAAVSELCGGSITVQKVVEDGIGGSRPGAGWAFTLDAPDDPTWATGVLTDDAGLAVFELHSLGSERVTVSESPQSGFTLQVDEITCDNATGPVPLLERNDDGVTFDLGPTDIVTCTFPNLRPPEPEPQVTTTTGPPPTSVPTTPTTPAPTTPGPTTTVDPIEPSSTTTPGSSAVVLGSAQEPVRATGSLPRTGADSGRLVVSGLSLAGGGALMVLGLRRRHDADSGL